MTLEIPILRSAKNPEGRLEVCVYVEVKSADLPRSVGIVYVDL